MSDKKTYQDLIQIFKSAKKQVQSFHEIPDDHFVMKPAPGRWSVHEICRHLFLFNNLYIEAIIKAAETNPKTTASVNGFTPGFFYRKYAGYMEPPYKMKVKTIKPFDPGKDSSGKHEVIASLEQTESKITELLTGFKNRNTDLEKTKGSNPVLTFLPMSVIDFLALIDAHQRRHFWQIEQTLKQIQAAKSVQDG